MKPRKLVGFVPCSFWGLVPRTIPLQNAEAGGIRTEHKSLRIMNRRPTPHHDEGLVPVHEPFSLAKTLRFVLSPPKLLNGRRFDPLLDYYEETEYRRVAEISSNKILYGVSEEKSEGHTRLRVRVLSGLRDAWTLNELPSLVQRQFSTALDISPFYRLAKGDAVLSRLAQHFGGMRIPQATNVFETLVCAILEQQVNLTFAYQVKKALIETYGDFIEHQDRRYNAFPEPAALAIATTRELRRLQISAPKARYIIAIARAVLDGSLDLDGLRQVDPAAAVAKLRAHKGVGPWTAQYVGLRALGHLDSLPAADVGLQKAIQRFYSLRKQPGAARVVQMFRPWVGWRSYATFYLWLTFWEDRAWNDRLVQEIRKTNRRARR